MVPPMPRLIDYAAVVTSMTSQGFVSLYYNSGAFGFPDGAPTLSVGWVCGEDPSIRPAARPLARRVPAPCQAHLATFATRVWLEHLPGPLRLTPQSHWAYELDFGNHTWLPAALEQAGLSADQVNALAARHDGSAVEFSPEESMPFERLLLTFVANLFGSDFLLTWPGRPVACTVHHHKQLWWTTTDQALMAALEALVPATG